MKRCPPSFVHLADFGNHAADQRAPGIWDDYHVIDGRLVTGQNPASAASTASAAVKVFEQL